MNNIAPQIDISWLAVMQNEFQKPYFAQLKDFLLEEKKKYAVYPAGSHIFSAFNLTPFNKVKAVILGQDPYHGAGQAHGLCFSVPQGVQHPPSLVNIFKELHDDLGCAIPHSGNLTKWAEQGVLMLNATLTVRANQAGSHQNKGWETFTNEVIHKLSHAHTSLVFILWGSYAQAKQTLIDADKHCILKAVHPSPLSAYRGFFGSKPFSKTNNYLKSKEKHIIDWVL